MYLRVNIKGWETRWIVMNKMSKNDRWSNVSWMVIRKDEHVRDLENGFRGLRRDLCISRDGDGNVLHMKQPLMSSVQIKIKRRKMLQVEGTIVRLLCMQHTHYFCQKNCRKKYTGLWKNYLCVCYRYLWRHFLKKKPFRFLILFAIYTIQRT